MGSAITRVPTDHTTPAIYANPHWPTPYSHQDPHPALASWTHSNSTCNNRPTSTQHSATHTQQRHTRWPSQQRHTRWPSSYDNLIQHCSTTQLSSTQIQHRHTSHPQPPQHTAPIQSSRQVVHLSCIIYAPNRGMLYTTHHPIQATTAQSATLSPTNQSS